MVSCGPSVFSICDALLDFRPRDAFEQRHWRGSFWCQWPMLRQLQSALPAPGARLGVIAAPSAAVEWLRQKRYGVIPLSAAWLDAACIRCPEHCETGWQVARLWSPSPPLEQWLSELFVAPGQALDVGCGGGRDAVWLAMQGWQVTAVDRSASVLTRARALAAYHGVTVDWRQMNLRTAWPVPPASQDLVLMMRLLLRDRFGVLAQSLRRGGRAFIWVFHPEAGHPSGPEKTMTPSEIAAGFPGFRTIVATIAPLPDGRPMSLWIGEKIDEDHYH